MGIWHNSTGEVDVEYIAADIPGALDAISKAGIPIRKAKEINELTVSFTVFRNHLQQLRYLAETRGDEIRIISRNGLFWLLRKLPKRPVPVVGVLAVVFLSLYLPTRILFVEVEGNEHIPDHLIISKSEDCGIGFWSSRREVRSEQMKNALLETLPELQWAGVNTYGCRAVISVRERAKPEENQKSGGISSIIADRDCVIRQMTVIQGSPVCKVGQSVKAGQKLVSGYTDLGICIRGSVAIAEIYGQTLRELTVVTPERIVEKGDLRHSDKKYSLIFGKKRINFFKGSGILDTTCDKMYMEYYLTLPGGFRLPVALGVELRQYRDCSDVLSTLEDAQPLLEHFAGCYLADNMTAGRIDSRFETITQTEDSFCLTGKYACYEMIGKSRLEENLLDYEAD